MVVDSIQREQAKFIILSAEIHDLESKVDRYNNDVSKMLRYGLYPTIMISSVFLAVWKIWGTIFPLIIFLPIGQFVFGLIGLLWARRNTQRMLMKIKDLKKEIDGQWCD